MIEGIVAGVIVGVLVALVGHFLSYIFERWREWEKNRELRKEIATLLLIEARQNQHIIAGSIENMISREKAGEQEFDYNPTGFRSDIYRRVFLERWDLLSEDTVNSVAKYYSHILFDFPKGRVNVSGLKKIFQDVQAVGEEAILLLERDKN